MREEERRYATGREERRINERRSKGERKREERRK